MKKILLILAVLALAAPTMAAISVNVVDNGNCTGDITYSMTGEAGDQRVRAWALKVEVDSGAVITAVDPHVAGESDAVNKGFGFFPGTIVIIGDVIDSNGTPVAPNDLPGAAGTGIGINTVVLEMASLHVDSNFPPDTGTLATITVSQACNVTITEEVDYRGGIVREDANQAIGATLPTNVPITCNGEPDCLIGGNAGPNEYSNWVSYGKPPCWCYRKQCRGDADGLASFFGDPVILPDLTIFKSAYNKSEAAVLAIPNAICADLDHVASFFGDPVILPDLTIFKAYYNQPGASVPECDQAPVITGPYNFWTN